jgi:hypothetical protein
LPALHVTNSASTSFYSIQDRNHEEAGPAWWPTPIILATWEEELRRITVQGLPGQKIQESESPLIKVGCGMPVIPAKQEA